MSDQEAVIREAFGEAEYDDLRFAVVTLGREKGEAVVSRVAALVAERDAYKEQWSDGIDALNLVAEDIDRQRVCAEQAEARADALQEALEEAYDALCRFPAPVSAPTIQAAERLATQARRKLGAAIRLADRGQA